MRRHEGGAGLDGRFDRAVDPFVDGDKAAQAERKGMGCLRGIGVVVGELEARDDEQSVPLHRAGRLTVELGQVGGMVRSGDPPWRVCEISAAGVIGDAEDVEAARAIQVDERGQFEQAVAPRRVRMQLGQQMSRPASASRSDCGRVRET